MIPKNEAERLYRESFTVYGNEPGIILEYAERYGRIHFIEHENQIAGMICTAHLRDGDFAAEYIFAACISAGHRGKGLFRKTLDEIFGSEPSVLIPENDGLFSMYEKMGYTPIFCLEAEMFGENTSEEFNGSSDELYEIYKSSFQFPKKDICLFKAAIKAHLAYGGEIKRFENSVVLVYGGNAVDIFSPTLKEAVSSAKSCRGNYKALLPLECADALKRENIDFSKKKIAMSKNILNTDIYINTLFN